MFDVLVKDAHGLYRWPDRPWLPLSFSLAAVQTAGDGRQSTENP
jgi:hypothetical protein